MIFDNDNVSGTFVGDTTLVHCRITGPTTVSGGRLTMRGCRAGGAYALSATSMAMDRASAYAIQVAGCTVDVLPDDLEGSDPIYGDGSSGASSPSSGITSTYGLYTNYTPTGTAIFRCDQFSFFRCNGLLDLSNAPTSAFYDADAGNGGNAAGATAGAAGANGANVAGYPNGGPPQLPSHAGAGGVTGAGTASTASALTWACYGGLGGACGATNAQTSQAADPVQLPHARPVGHPVSFIQPGGTFASGTLGQLPVYGSSPGRAGSSGSGDGTNAGGGGGGSASSAQPMCIYARGIKTSVSTAAGVIQGSKRSGGKGGNGAGGNANGGAGAGGTGGTFIDVLYDWRIGPAVANGVSAPGGDGGDGGNGVGTGIGGDGGTGGQGGQIRLKNRITGVVTFVVGTNGTAGAAHLGTTGGAHGPGGASSATL